ncbi:hypothetical protein Pcinc_001604 [Petrolisthes cinctipes]|uniref:Uncharacterized protein n=1 Tax=Petrolisthes cinctipes TaxID=88211 RepID=A0AAE1GMM2_PETCI|nr:hypothetical protein Pcinc_001604 [Petrolisthes cinctipes]
MRSHASCKGAPLISSPPLSRLTPLLLPLPPFYLSQSPSRRHSRYHLLLSLLYLGTQHPQQAQLLALAHLHLHPSREILLPPPVTIALHIPLQPTEKNPVPLHQLGEVQVATELAETTHANLPPRTQERLAVGITRPLYTNRASHKEVVTTIDPIRQTRINAHTLSHFCPCPPRVRPPPGSTATTARGLDTRTTTATGKTGVITAAEKVIQLIAVDLSLLEKDTRSSVTN